MVKLLVKTKAMKKPSGSFPCCTLPQNVCQVRWNDSKVVTIATTCVGAKPLQKAEIFIPRKEKDQGL